MDTDGRRRRTESKIKDKSGFCEPILVFFQKNNQNRSRDPRQCLVSNETHRECPETPDPVFRAIEKFHRVAPNIFLMDDQNANIDLKPIQFYMIVSILTCANWILALGCYFFHTKLQTVLSLISHEFHEPAQETRSCFLDFAQCDASYCYSS